jgi:hypothetical protein
VGKEADVSEARLLRVVAASYRRSVLPGLERFFSQQSLDTRAAVV